MLTVEWLYEDREREAEQKAYSRWCEERRNQHIALVELARTRRARLAAHTPLVNEVTDDTDGIIWYTGVREW